VLNVWAKGQGSQLSVGEDCGTRTGARHEPRVSEQAKQPRIIRFEGVDVDGRHLITHEVGAAFASQVCEAVRIAALQRDPGIGTGPHG